MTTWTIQVEDNRVVKAPVQNTWTFEDHRARGIKIQHVREWESNGWGYAKEVAVVKSSPCRRYFSREDARKIYAAILKKARAEEKAAGSEWIYKVTLD